MAASRSRPPMSLTDYLTVSFATAVPRDEQCRQLPSPGPGLFSCVNGKAPTHQVTVVNDGFLWNGETYRSLSRIAHAITGTKWNGPRFFGMREVNGRQSETRRGR